MWRVSETLAQPLLLRSATGQHELQRRGFAREPEEGLGEQSRLPSSWLMRPQ